MTVAVAVIALLPIAMGSLVTTLGAGMAFLDWPSSDGQNMLLYPWFSDFRAHPDKFVEHGHRLAGMLIGLAAIVLVAVAYRCERTRWVRRGAIVILAGVIAQGLLGGMRVLLDRQVLAMLHSITAALFFCGCVVFAAACRDQWRAMSRVGTGGLTAVGMGLVYVLPVVVLAQYILGGAVRHMHTMVHEHIAGAVVTSLLAMLVVITLAGSGNAVLRRSAWWLVSALALQVVLGLGSFVARLGLPSFGYVAVAGSLLQSLVCSAHTVGGMLLLNAAVLPAVATSRLVRGGALLIIQADSPSGARVRQKGMNG